MAVSVESYHEKVDKALQMLRRQPVPQNAVRLNSLLKESRSPLSFHVQVPSSEGQISLDDYALNVLRQLMDAPGGYFLITGHPYLPSNDVLGDENPVATQLLFTKGRVVDLIHTGSKQKNFYTDLYVPIKRVFLAHAEIP